jgi:hypothetical protein
MAFWATAPGVRFNCFATAVPDNFALANALSVRTSSFDHATIRRLDFDLAFAMNALRKSTHHSARRGQCSIAAALRNISMMPHPTAFSCEGHVTTIHAA